MKHVYIVPPAADVQDVIAAQARKFISEDDLVLWNVSDDIKMTLKGLQDQDLGDYFIFCPPWTVLLEAPDMKALGIVAAEMENRGLAYTRLRKIGNSSSKTLEGSNEMYRDSGSNFFMCPHLFKTSEFHTLIDNSREPDMLYWQSLELGKLNGAVFYRKGDQPDMKLSYWRSSIYHAISDILADTKWSDTHLDFNGEPLRPILANLGIDPETRGIGSIGGCCYDLG